MNYDDFLLHKVGLSGGDGFDPVWMPDFLFPFQANLLEWGIRQGRQATYADCGLGKTILQLVWAENVCRHANGKVLGLTPLAVAAQTEAEASKFGIECSRQKSSKIIVTNYERLHYYDTSDFVGVFCDESAILKSYDGARRSEITEFMRRVPYRSLWTATAAPNDYTELGTSSEALGYLGYMDMLNRFFKNDLNNSATGRVFGNVLKWRFKGHAEEPFWKWVCSWARAIRKPSDLGFEDGAFVLPPLRETEYIIESGGLREGMLFNIPAVGLKEQREELKLSLKERCEKAAELTDGHDCSISWCHLNAEGDLLEKLIPDSVQVSGDEQDEAKEEKLIAFARKQVKRLITKPRIGGWGLNYQHCAHQTVFPSHSFEQYYQSVRRSWRFGQTRPVQIDIVTTEGGRGVLENLQRKQKQADKMFESLIERMNEQLNISKASSFEREEMVPAWL
jgi:hypothetical protein